MAGGVEGEERSAGFGFGGGVGDVDGEGGAAGDGLRGGHAGFDPGGAGGGGGGEQDGFFAGAGEEGVRPGRRGVRGADTLQPSAGARPLHLASCRLQLALCMCS